MTSLNSPESLNTQQNEAADPNALTEQELSEVERISDSRGISMAEARAAVLADRVSDAPRVKLVALDRHVDTHHAEPFAEPVDVLFDFNDSGDAVSSVAELASEEAAHEKLEEERREWQMKKAERLIRNGASQVAVNAMMRAHEERRNRIS